VSRERVRDEILKMLTEGAARRAFEILDGAGLLELILPEVAKMKGVAQPPEFHPEGDVWIHTRMMLEKMGQPSPTLALGVLLHDVGKPPTFQIADRIRFNQHAEVGAVMTEEICQRLRLSNRDSERVVELVRHHLRFKDAPKMKASTFKRFISMDGFEEHLELHRLDCLPATATSPTGTSSKSNGAVAAGESPSAAPAHRKRPASVGLRARATDGKDSGGAGRSAARGNSKDGRASASAGRAAVSSAPPSAAPES
jgi:putative nucleotidyltransferase with HDIG domain